MSTPDEDMFSSVKYCDKERLLSPATFLTITFKLDVNEIKYSLSISCIIQYYTKESK